MARMKRDEKEMMMVKIWVQYESVVAVCCRMDGIKKCDDATFDGYCFECTCEFTNKDIRWLKEHHPQTIIKSGNNAGCFVGEFY
jgi:hypothetical protein